ncbi:hypothetical protein LuPra_02548 [Luteitalea pratensis]|uniref:Uncharacterized protein n=1 Tax=Luteitalea pratensis TaxID=1855912 RepID=A0A143PM98_LUTPR|nr:hypothetical protein [Luteitalea pratensis]AMY09333.1 hypothetical protein LuPra_02548 [Luteitalea pratensis]
MTATRFTRISGMTLVGVLTLAGSTVLGSGATTQEEGRGTLEGTWLNQVKIVTCSPAPFAVIATVQSMTTYMHGGVLIEGGGPPAPPPAASRSAGHGIWERTGGHTFLVFFRSHSFDNLGRHVRITEVTSHPTLIQGDNPDTPDFVEPYYLSGDGTNTITNLNPVDGTVISVTEGCNTATSAPLLF